MFEPAPVAYVALSERVVAALRRAVILGELTAGLHLEEPALAAKFGVSRLPIREALGRLAHEGLVRIEPRRGAFVLGTTEEDIRDIYEFRLLLETHAVHRAVTRLDAAASGRMQALVDRMRAAVRQGQLQLIPEPDVNFHQQIVAAAGNRRLLAAWEQIVGLVGTILSIADTSYHRMPEAVESHQRILDALVERDAGTAERLLRSHLEDGLVIMCEAMRKARVAAAGDGHEAAT